MHPWPNNALRGSRFPRLRLRALPALLVALVLAACGVDTEQARVCEFLIPAFEPAPERIDILDREPAPDDPAALVIRYRAPDDDAPHWIACRFAGRHFDAGRLALTGVATDRTGELTGTRWAMLRIWMNLRPPAVRAAGSADAPRPAAAAPTARDRALYLLQQVVNSLTLSCVYGLLAIGYTLVYGIIGQINLAFGELYMIGAMITVIGVTLFVLVGAGTQPLALLVVLAVAMALTAVQGWAMERLVFRPLRGVGTHTPLIAAIGLSIGLQEYVRLLQGARDRWLQPVFNDVHRIAAGDTFPVHMLSSQVLIVALTAVLYLMLWRLLARTAYGRAVRACADDMGTAALLGVDVGRVVAVTFAVGGAYAAAAGFIIALYYGGVNFFMGFLIGFKALTAAIVGGIGSVPGAMLGGALIGVFETFWSAYFDIAYKDVAVFGVLALFLVFRPEGLLGQPRSRGD